MNLFPFALVISFAFACPLGVFASEPTSLAVYGANTLILKSDFKELPRNNTWKNHGVPFDAFMGVKAYANRSNGEYQCTELVHRFLRTIFRIPTAIGMGLGHANDLVQNIYNRFSGDNYSYEGISIRLKSMENGNADEPPAVGSAVNFSSGSFGHVAIVRYVEIISPNKVRAYLFEQHGFPRWSEGEKKPLRSFVVSRNKGKGWSAQAEPEIGRPLHWIGFTKSR